MAENTNIAWADHTFNPWIGCTKVSAGCDNCYAEDMMDRRYHRVQWGHGNPRSRTSEANWRKPLQWNKRITGRRQRVFCASLADVFDTEVNPEWRLDLFGLILSTREIDWLLLTKRPHMMRKFFEMIGPVSNVWAGTTVEDQEVQGRINDLLNVPGVAQRFLSVEPMLGPLRLPDHPASNIDWVICGGESGSNARPFNPDWARALRDQCQEQSIPFFMKQMGGNTKAELEAIPDDLMIREFPPPKDKR